MIVSDTSFVRKVNLIINVNAGPVIRIGKIYVESDILNKDNAIIPASGLQTNDIFSRSSFEAGRLRLLKYGLFSSVSIDHH